MRLFFFHRYSWDNCAISLAGGFDLRVLKWWFTFVPKAIKWSRPSYWYVSRDATPKTSIVGSRCRYWSP
jgi:hypothetical protein